MKKKAKKVLPVLLTLCLLLSMVPVAGWADNGEAESLAVNTAADPEIITNGAAVDDTDIAFTEGKDKDEKNPSEDEMLEGAEKEDDSFAEGSGSEGTSTEQNQDTNTDVDKNTAEAEDITVLFTLMGDSHHGENKPHENWQVWIPQREVTVSKDAVVFDVFDKVLQEEGIAYDETQPGYIGGITAPKSFGGYDLYEGNNGPNSGWMFQLNEEHPTKGLRQCEVNDGDTIIWHYVDDYTSEGKLDWRNIEGEENPGGGDNPDISVDTVLAETGQYICNAVPEPGFSSIGGEWAVMGLSLIHI